MLVKENVGHLLYKINRDRLISLYDECKLREQEYENTDNEIISFILTFTIIWKALYERFLRFV